MGVHLWVGSDQRGRTVFFISETRAKKERDRIQATLDTGEQVTSVEVTTELTTWHWTFETPITTCLILADGPSCMRTINNQ